MAFIFQNSSYFVLYNCTNSVLDDCKNFATTKGVRVLKSESLEDLEGALAKIRFLNAFIVPEDVTQDEINKIKELAGPRVGKVLRVCNTSPFDDVQSISTETAELRLNLLDILNSLIPERLEELLIFSAETLIESYMPGIEMNFKTEAAVEPEKFDFVTICSIVAEPFVGYGTEYVDIDKLTSTYGELEDRTQEQLGDFGREFLNQTLGILNRYLLEIDLNTAIGVPEQYTPEQLQNTRRTGPYVPNVCIKDQHGIFDVRIGFVHREGKSMMDLSKVDLTPVDDEIDFF
jgi:hypothetical protein